MHKLPRISNVGLQGLAVTFADNMSDSANRAAIAFRAAVHNANWPEVTETASTLVSTFIGVDLGAVPFDDMHTRVSALLATRDWYKAQLPPGRKLWTLPMCFDPERAPQLDEAAHVAGLSREAALSSLTSARTRVITVGFAPGQPYLGMLDAAWDIPRQTELTPQVPPGALVLAIRQFVLFTAAMPTGWRHVGQTAFRPFDVARPDPFLLAPGDEVRFAPITAAELAETEEHGDSLGGATWELLA